MYLKRLKLEVTLHSLHSNCKNLQKSVLTNVNIQRTGKTSLQMFAYFIFDGSFICRFLYIFRPSSVPRPSICLPQLKKYTLIINYLYLQILHFASGNDLLAKNEQQLYTKYIKKFDFLVPFFNLFLLIIHNTPSTSTISPSFRGFQHPPNQRCSRKHRH